MQVSINRVPVSNGDAFKYWYKIDGILNQDAIVETKDKIDGLTEDQEKEILKEILKIKYDINEDDEIEINKYE